MVFIGSTVAGKYGLVNSTAVTKEFVAVNAGSTSYLWLNKTADEILKDVNTLLQDAWTASGLAVCPSKLLLPPAQFALICSMKVSSAGNVSVLQYLEDNSIALKANGKKLDVTYCKWLTGRGIVAGSPAAATDRMVVYSQDPGRVRFPMTPITKTPLEYRGLYHITTYWGRFGVVEIVYPSCIRYADGI
jgi:hypothetical protein